MRPAGLQGDAQHAAVRVRAALRLARQEQRRVRPKPDEHTAADPAPGRARQPAVHGGHRILRGAHTVPQRAEAAPADGRGGAGRAEDEVVPACAQRPLLPVLRPQPDDAGLLRPQRRRRGGQRLLPGQFLVTS
jgi:hypothetical protein